MVGLIISLVLFAAVIFLGCQYKRTVDFNNTFARWLLSGDDRLVLEYAVDGNIYCMPVTKQNVEEVREHVVTNLDIEFVIVKKAVFSDEAL